MTETPRPQGAPPHHALHRNQWGHTLHRLGPHGVLAEVVLAVILGFTLLRIVMLAVWVGTDLGPGAWVAVLAAGLRFDLLVGLLYVLPQLLRVTVFGGRPPGRYGRAMFEAEWLVAFGFLPFLCAAELVFFEEFQSRLNYIAFEYLVYPTEVCCNIWQSYPIVS